MILLYVIGACQFYFGGEKSGVPLPLRILAASVWPFLIARHVGKLNMEEFKKELDARNALVAPEGEKP